MAANLFATPQLPDSINSMFNQDTRSDYVILYDRTERVYANHPVARFDLKLKLNQVVKWVGGSISNLSHALMW